MNPAFGRRDRQRYEQHLGREAGCAERVLGNVFHNFNPVKNLSSQNQCQKMQAAVEEGAAAAVAQSYTIAQFRNCWVCGFPHGQSGSSSGPC